MQGKTKREDQSRQLLYIVQTYKWRKENKKVTATPTQPPSGIFCIENRDQLLNDSIPFLLFYFISLTTNKEQDDPSTSHSARPLDPRQVAVQNLSQRNGPSHSCILDHGMQEGSRNVCPPFIMAGTPPKYTNAFRKWGMATSTQLNKMNSYKRLLRNEFLIT